MKDKEIEEGKGDKQKGKQALEKRERERKPFAEGHQTVSGSLALVFLCFQMNPFFSYWWPR